MRRGKFKVRSKNSMGILVLIVFLALIPIIICLTELREQHFIFQMISQSIKEKQTGAGDVLGISILDTILSTISIAVSVWIGLNIYNVYKKEDIEKNKKEFVDSFINATDNDGIAAIDNKTEFNELNIKPITLDKDQLEHVDQRVLNYFNLNKSIISGDFTPAQWNAFYETVLEPLAIYLEQSFKMKIFSKKAIRDGNSISFSVNRVQYASLEEKVKLVKEVCSMGLLTVVQALMFLDLAPIGGDDG